MKHLPLIVCLAGLTLYLLPLKEAKVTEIGRLSFAVGLLAVLLGWKG
jgi:hypothetical protein